MNADIRSDSMTTRSAPGAETAELPFESSELQALGLRVTRAEFSRLMDCSRQAVTDWVRAGRIVVGPDGRFDPRAAVRSLLATGDPAKIRARVLAPLADELVRLRTRNVEVEAQFAAATERANHLDAACEEYEALFRALRERLVTAWPALRREPDPNAILAWLDASFENGEPADSIVTYVLARPSPADDALAEMDWADFDEVSLPDLGDLDELIAGLRVDRLADDQGGAGE